MDSDAALDTPDEDPCHGFNVWPTHWREIRALARAGLGLRARQQFSCFSDRVELSVCGVHDRVGRAPGPGSIKNGGTESSPRIASLEVKFMKTRNAWLALVVLLAVHGSARSDFIATATLTGDGESNSTGTGYGTVTFSTATDSLTVALMFSGLASPTEIPPGVPGAAHIHFGNPGAEFWCCAFLPPRSGRNRKAQGNALGIRSE
jgi:hypothetical protein